MLRAPGIAVLIAAACLAESALAGEGTGTGVRGDVHTGPTCPTETVPPRPGCEDRPYQTVIRIRELPSGELVKTVRSGKRGRFRARLEPGRYRLRARGGRKGFPSCEPKQVTVQPHRVTRVHLMCDTGIR